MAPQALLLSSFCERLANRQETGTSTWGCSSPSGLQGGEPSSSSSRPGLTPGYLQPVPFLGCLSKSPPSGGLKFSLSESWGQEV